VKRLLLVNLYESPENLHFERALARAVGLRPGLALDVLHDFDFDYEFLGFPEPPRGERFKCSGAGLAGLKKKYHRVILLDFPKRARCSAAFLRLAGGALGAPVFVANHLCPMPKDNFTADLSRRLKALSGVRAGFVLESDDARLWGEFGLPAAALLRRGYAVDCDYYRPQRLKPGDYVFSAGSTGRDFKALWAGARLAKLGMTVLTESKPLKLPGATFLPLTKNLDKLRAWAAGARAVVIPLKDGCVNDAAGNSIAFLSMAMGQPVLTRRTPYMQRFITDGSNGFFYDRLSPAAVAAGLRRVQALSPAARGRLAAAARKTILQKAGLDRFCSALLKKMV
jgi:hypothetical protein